MRTICQGKGSQFVVGSTRNSILQGTFELNFQEIVTGHVDEVWALAAHPQQNQFLTAGYDNLVHLWDTLTHRAVWSSNIGVLTLFRYLVVAAAASQAFFTNQHSLLRRIKPRPRAFLRTARLL